MVKIRRIPCNIKNKSRMPTTILLVLYRKQLGKTRKIKETKNNYYFKKEETKLSLLLADMTVFKKF